MKFKISGMSLLEAMLVLAIGSAIVVMGLREYRQYKIQSYISDIKKNVTLLFQGLGQYYQANCRSLSDEDSIQGGTYFSQGSLAPGGSVNDLNVQYNSLYALYPILIKENLVDNHFLQSNWKTDVPLVDPDPDSYRASFLFQVATKQAYACWNINGVQCTDKQDIRSDNVGFWLAQVSIKVNDDPDGSKIRAYFAPSGASCMSSEAYGCVDTSDTGPTPQYLIWRQLPTKSGSRVNSDLWLSQAQEVMFNQQYTHDVVYEMTSKDSDPNYFICGN